MKGAVRWLRSLWPAGTVAAVVQDYERTFRRAPLVLADLAHLCHAARSTIAADPYETAFNEGKRAVWLHIAEMLSLKPEDYVTIVKEIEHE